MKIRIFHFFRILLAQVEENYTKNNYLQYWEYCRIITLHDVYIVDVYI